MNHARGAAAALALLLAAIDLDAHALDLDTSLRTSIWSKSQDLNDDRGIVSAQLWARAADAATVGDADIKFYGEGWISRVDGGGGDDFDQRLREAYGQLSYGSLELRAGWQMFPWGRTDGINPTDNLTPRQFTLLTRDLDDQRFGTPALRATWFSDPVSLNLIWLAGFRPSVLPWPAAAPQARDAHPADPAAQWAARLESVQDSFEGSLSYFDGYDVLPSAAIAATPTLVQLEHGRIKVAGGDFAATVGRFVFRAEAAHTAAPAAVPGAVFNLQPQTYIVAGGERTFGEYLDVDIQGYFRRVEGGAVPAGLSAPDAALGQQFAVTAQQYDRVDRGFTFRVADQWLNETLEASFSGVFSVARRGYLLRPLIKYRATDALTVSLGADVFGGDARTLYGSLVEDSSAYLECRWGF